MDIIFKKVTVAYRDSEILKDFCCEFKEGELTLLKGPSGIGKTTVLNLTAGLLKPDSGSIYIDKTQRIRAVFQEDRLLENMSIYANLKLVSEESLSLQELEKLLCEVGLDISPFEKISSLSGGMKRRIAILRALIPNPDILLLDEAFSGMDEETAKKVLSFIMKEARGKTIIASTHRAELFEKYPHFEIEL